MTCCLQNELADATRMYHDSGTPFVRVTEMDKQHTLQAKMVRSDEAAHQAGIVQRGPVRCETIVYYLANTLVRSRTNMFTMLCIHVKAVGGKSMQQFSVMIAS